MKLLIDMNLSPRWVEWLAQSDIEAKHWSKIGAATAPDTEIMAYAAANDFVILTNDLDFGTILAANQGSKPSVIQLRAENLNPQQVGPFVSSAIFTLVDALTEGVLLTIDADRTRVAMLPLRLRS
jgi:predicted nuclease of predicted toxin-antitoxin system